MAINSPKPGAPNPTPTPMAPKQDNSKQRIIAIAAIIGVALLAINIALLIGYNNRGKATANLTSELNESEQLKAELEQQYYEALSELEEMRGDNEQLNAMIDQQKEELKQQKTRIDDLIRTERSYNKIRKEMASLKSQADQYIAEINQLREENAELTTQNTQLAESNQELNSNLTIAQEANDQLNTEKALLVSEKEELSSEKANLSRKVNIASVIKVESFDIQPMMVRKSGKAVKRNNADKIDYLSICFNTAVNEIAEPGNEQFVIRVITPSGETMAVDQLGSGVFTSNATGEQIRFTTIEDMSYDRSAGQVCSKWDPDQSFGKGNYDVEIYNKGYLAGTTSFQLK